MSTTSDSRTLKKVSSADNGHGEHVEDFIEAADISLSPAEDVSYGRGGVRGLFDSPFVGGAALLASLGGFSFGYDQGVISIINVMKQFHEVFPDAATPFGKGFMTGMLEFGAFLGCLFMPTLADKISRKRALTVVVAIFNIGAIMQTAAPSYGVLVAGRTIGGIGVGTLAMGSPIYISEIAPPNLRGTLLVLESISIVTGVVISFFITYGTRHMAGEVSFRLPLGLQMVCSTLLGIGINFYPYSPRWLALVNRPQEALDSLVRLRRLPADDHRVQAEHRGIISEVEVQKIVQERNHPGKGFWALEFLGWRDLFSRKLWRRTAVAVGIAFFQQFSGINAFIYYAPTLFQSLGQSEEMALIMSGVFNILQLVAVAACFFIIDKVGRRPLAIFGGLGGGTAWAIMAILTGVYSKNWAANPAAGWGAVAMAFVFVLLYGISYSPLGWILAAEVYPNSHRSKGVALGTATVWLCNFIVGVATPPMMDQLGFGTYVFFGAWCFIASVWAFYLVPETKGKTLEQMDEVFKDTSAQEEKEIIRQQIAASRGQSLGGATMETTKLSV
ncbi:high-affinity glucose [Colletotrichum truncatum]|uniref:High-affinity glucose n=1 Tax=Colletotrichum truncatum TaxID=5467 RepID=A0ACC3YSX4_COLTU|nr:high-affinity glucose [Colletotrichum truncatum]KAF6782163.1 high-affinity glucose [Colletotrichum truncatum]